MKESHNNTHEPDGAVTSPVTSLERLLTTLGQQDADHVPLFLTLTMHGARELGMSLQDYFSHPDNVINGQMRLLEKYHHDCCLPFFYAGVEVEAFGGEVIYAEDGPVNSGKPLLTNAESVKSLSVPDIEDCPSLRKVLDATEGLKREVGGIVPIVGVVIGPFSLPVMQLGFAPYLDLIFHERELLEKLLKVNEQFCLSWAKAQLDAGATGICYFDPVSSPTIVPPAMFREIGQPLAKRIISQLPGPVVIHFASGRCLPVLEDLIDTGAVGLGIGPDDDLTELRRQAAGRISFLGNLNGIEMRKWTPEITREKVSSLLAQAGPGGGFILADSHGEIPWQVPDEVVMTISETVRNTAFAG